MRRLLSPPLLLLLLGQAAPPPSAPASQAPAPTSAPATPLTDLYSLKPDSFFKRPDVAARITRNSVDVPLLETAIFHASNQQRTANKLTPFKHSWALNEMARDHSAEMATLHYFEHDSPVAKNHTLSDRLQNVGLTNLNAGENIAVLPAREMGSGSYTIEQGPDGTEIWTDSATGKRIDYYTYAEFAQAVVQQWMNSPPHRANLLNPKFLFLGVGVARGTYAKDQDSFYATQNFSDIIRPASEARAKALLVPAKPATAPQ